MILSIIAYGDPRLKRRSEPVADPTSQAKFVEDLFETMYAASGVGLAAPQVGQNVRIFVVDGGELLEEEEGEGAEFKEVFINPEVLEEEGPSWGFEEGCLSIPGVRENVDRPEVVRLRYQDLEGNTHEAEFDGLRARIIQHEYDHLEGVLFTDHINPLKRQLLKKRLANIAKGKVDAPYRMSFPQR